MSFVNLHTYTHFSILNSLIAPRDLFVRAKELGQTAVAITDHSSLAGVWDGLKASRETGVKLIVGCEFFFRDDRHNEDEKRRTIVLIAKNHAGYKNLLHLTSKGFDKPVVIGKKLFPLLDWNLIKDHSDGIICLTGDTNGVVGQLINGKNFDAAESTMKRLYNIYGDNLGVEIQSHYLNRVGYNGAVNINQQFTNVHLVRLANKFNLRVVPTNAARYLKGEQQKIHDTMLAVGAMQPIYSNARVKYDTQDLYLKSYDEMKAFFSRGFPAGFAEKICENSLYFANLCEKPDWVEPKFSNPGGKELPTFPVANEPDYAEFCIWMDKQPDERKKLEEDKNYLRFKCEKVLMQKTLLYNDVYRQRFEYELDVLYYCGTSSYMLITMDFMNWARNNNIAIGPGRGSAGGSLIGYLLGIHQADPIKYGLVFERFYSKKRTSYADIDNDISKEHRDKVLQYLIGKYGSDKFAQITNFIYITPKVYVRDVCRSLELGGDRKAAVALGDEIADVIPKIVDGKEVRTYGDMLKYSALYSEKYSKRYPELAACAAICGKPRANGIHASGIIISNRPLADVAPTRLDKDNVISIQFDKDRAEEAGLVKIDILGLETLDIIETTNRLIKENGKEVPKIDYEVYDKKAYDLITSGNTFGVFQFGTSGGTIDLCKRIKPKSIEDLAVITTLARPASKEIRDDFIRAREGKQKHRLLHSSLENALKSTFGFPLYDEQLLVLAKDVAGWELDEADKLRKLTKEKGKNPEKAEKWRQEFIQGASKNNIPNKVATEIWHTIVEPFGRYSFNKSHAVLYSMTSYHTAYLKAHFPVEFLLANLMYEIRSNAKIADKNIEKIKQEMRACGIKILPPNINTSGMTYQIQKDGTLLTGFEALKNVGADAIKEIIASRPFKSFDDFILRTDSQKVRANTVQALAASGCLDDFKIPRRVICLYIADYKKKLQVWLKKHDPSKETFEYPWPLEKEWSPPEIYAVEKEITGEAFTFGIKQAYGNFFDGQSTPVRKILDQLGNKDVVSHFKGVIKDVFEFKVKKETSKYLGQSMIKATIEDEYGNRIVLTAFPDRYKDSINRIKFLSGGKSKGFDEGGAIYLTATVNEYEGETGLILENIHAFRLEPGLPRDFKEKKTVRATKKSPPTKKDESLKLDDIDVLVEELEDNLFDEGLIDLEGEGENDDE